MLFRVLKKIQLIALSLVILSATTLSAAQVTLFAAASLTESLKQIAAAYSRQSVDQITFNFGASSLLARQIEEGAPADIFFSADEAKMDALAKKGLVLNDTRRSRLSNSLVIVVAAEGGPAIESAKDLATAKVKRFALAEPKTVPAGIYAREYLQNQNLWSVIQAKVVPTENVRAALSAVEAGNVEAAIVYKTDAAISKRVKIACELSAANGPSISYPMAVLKESNHVEEAKKFIEYLNSDQASRIFETFGFVVRK